MAKLISHFKGNILHTTDMQKAVAFAFEHTEKGKICLLSTASPSYSNWKNFEEKGSAFQTAIQSFASPLISEEK